MNRTKTLRLAYVKSAANQMGQQGSVVWCGTGGVLKMKKLIPMVLMKRITCVAVLLCFTSVIHVGYAEQEPYLSQLPCDQFIEKCNQYLEENEGSMRLMPASPANASLLDPELRCYESGITDDSKEHVTTISMYVKHGSIVGIYIVSRSIDDIGGRQMACALLSTLKIIGLAEQDVNEELKKGVGDRTLWSPLLGRNISLNSSKVGKGLLFQIVPQGYSLIGQAE